MTKKTNNQQGAAEVKFAQIPLVQIGPNEFNARRFLENMTPQRRARFNELVQSILEKGIIVPLLVRPLGPDRYEVIAGERRYRAALEVCNIKGLHPEKYLVLCIVRDIDENEAYDLMLIENLQREDLTPFETAQSLQAYLKRHGNSADSVNELAIRTGIPPYDIRRYVRILELPAEVLAAWKDGTLTKSHAEHLMRVGDQTQIIELFTSCVRLKLTVRELAERIGTVSPDLERGAFDKAECQTCQYNTSVQSGLFADLTPAGKCGNGACFELKQAACFKAKWETSKACEKFGTLGFRFGHRLTEEHRQPPPASETSGRCLECEQFVSVLRLTGAVISGYERTCLGPLPCFTALYCDTPLPVAAEQKQTAELAPEDDEHEQVPKVQPTEQPQSATKQVKAKAQEETGPVFSAQRGEKYREAFYSETLPDLINGTYAQSPRVPHLALLSLALSSSTARIHLCAGLGVDKSAKVEVLAEKILQLPPDDVMGELQLAACAHVMDQNTDPEIRRMVAEHFSLDLAKSWSLNKDYLDALSKSELIRIGEEPGVLIWQDDQVKTYKQKHHKGKALMALKREDLVAMILESGADLAGRVPAEILGVRKG